MEFAESGSIGIKLLSGHRGEVNTCSISPNRDIIATGGHDGRIYIWKAEDGLLLCTLSGHRGPVNCCAFSPCGKRIASGSYDTTGKIWDVGSPKCLATLRGHVKSIEGLCYSHDGKLVATVSWDKSAIVWDATTGLEMHRYEQHSDCVSACFFSFDSGLLATGGWDCAVIVWKLSNDKVRVPAWRHREPNLGYDVFKGHTGKVSSVCFSRVGILASGSWDRTVKLWNCRSRQLIITFEGHTGWVKALSFGIDSVELASAADDGFVRVWNIPKLELVRELKGETDIAITCNFDSNGTLISSGTAKESQIKKYGKNASDDESLLDSDED